MQESGTGTKLPNYQSVQSKVQNIFGKLENLKEISSQTRAKSFDIRERLIGSPGKASEAKDRPESVGILGRIIDELNDVRENLMEAIAEQEEILKETEK